MSTVYLLRHARPAADPKGNPPLSAEGRADAERLVPVLMRLGLTRIVTSPLQRAIETVAPFASASGIQMDPDPRLEERRMPFVPDRDSFLQHVRESFRDPAYTFDGAESYQSVVARAGACLEEALTRTPIGLLLAGHGQCLCVLLASLDPAVGYPFWQSLPMPAIIEVTIDTGGGNAASARGSSRILNV